MNQLNSVVVEGNMVRAADLRLTKSGTPVSSFTIGVNRRYKAGEEYLHETSFFEVEAWKRLAELSGRMGEKGRLVRVSGRLRQNRWQDGDGKNCSRVVIVAENLEFRLQGKGVASSVDEEAPSGGAEPD